MTIVKLTRERVRTVHCPACAARPGEMCVGARRKSRVSNHLERVELAEKVYEERP